MVYETWRPMDRSSTGSHALSLMNIMKSLKKTTITWEKEKMKRDTTGLREIGDELEQMECMGTGRYENEEKRDYIKSLKTRRRKVLLDNEEKWRLKSRAIWLSVRDENTIFFKFMQRVGKNQTLSGN